jgi:glycerate kinase
VRILIAPDAFKGTLSASQAAAAIAQGWQSSRPAAELIQRPISDGGAGFVDALASALGLEIQRTPVSDSFGAITDAKWCRHGSTAYLEVAQVVGLDRGTNVLRATSFGVGELLLAAIAAGATEIVVGLGGTNVNDAGAGMFAALGARAVDAAGFEVSLRSGPLPLGSIHAVDLSEPERTLQGVSLRAATDVEVPLLGPRGATYGFAPQKGAMAPDLLRLETALSVFASACGRRSDGKDAAVALGAGAAGGLGFALLRLGAQRVAGIEHVLDASDLNLSQMDLVVTGEGALDWQSMQGKSVAGVARRCLEMGIPVVAIAGRIDITARERSEMGLDAAYSVSELVGESESMLDPAASLSRVAARVARTWS